MSGVSLGGTAPWWWATVSVGVGLFAQAVRVVYTDYTGDIRAKTKQQSDRILALEAALSAAHGTHLADVTKLMLDAVAREHGVVLAMNAIPELPELMRQEMATLRQYLAAERESTRSMFDGILRPVLGDMLRVILRDLTREDEQNYRTLLREELDRVLGNQSPRKLPRP